MEIIGPVAETTGGSTYICVLMDWFTKWCEGFAIPAKTAANLGDCIVRFVYRFGAPKRILTDQRREFLDEVRSILSLMFLDCSNLLDDLSQLVF